MSGIGKHLNKMLIKQHSIVVFILCIKIFLATKMEYDHNGQIIKKTPCSRQVGTTVSLSNLFHSLPVRQKEFHKNVKREFNKMTQLLYAYCLIATGVKWVANTRHHYSTLNQLKILIINHLIEPNEWNYE